MRGGCRVGQDAGGFVRLVVWGRGSSFFNILFALWASYVEAWQELDCIFSQSRFVVVSRPWLWCFRNSLSSVSRFDFGIYDFIVAPLQCDA